jgi:DNA-binding SARP family transcriptional activator
LARPEETSAFDHVDLRLTSFDDAIDRGQPAADAETMAVLRRLLLGLQETSRLFGEAHMRLTSLRDSGEEMMALLARLLEADLPATQSSTPSLHALPLTLGDRIAERVVPLPRTSPETKHRLQVRLLGRFEVEVDGTPLADWRSRRARQLFEYLLLNHREEISRHRLMGLFWPDHSEERAENNLSLTIMALRRHLDAFAGAGKDLIGFAGGCYFVDTASLSLDINEFDSALEEAAVLDATGDRQAASRALDHAISLYRGDLLPGDLYEEWTVGRRREIQDRFVGALSQRAEIARDSGNSDLSIQLLHRLLELDPASESTHRQLILDYVSTGQRSRAAVQVNACRDALLRHLGVEPSVETQTVFALVSTR